MDKARAERLQQKYKRASSNQPPGNPGAPRGPRGGGPTRGMLASGKPKNTRESIRRLFSYIAADRYKIITACICVVLHAGGSLAASYMLRPIINTFLGPEGSGDLNGLLYALIGMLMLYLVSIGAQYLQARIMIGVSQGAIRRIRQELYEKVQKLPLSYYDTHAHGDIMSHFTNDIDHVGEMLNQSVVQFVSGLITIVGTFCLMVYTSPILTAVTLLTLPLMGFIVKTITRFTRRLYKEQQAALGAMNGYIEESVSGQKVVKIFCREDVAEDEFEFLNRDYALKQFKAQTISSFMGPLMHNTGNLNYALTGCVGAALAVTRNFDLGGLTIFLNFSRQFNNPISQLSQQMNIIYSALAGAERVFTAMDEAPEAPDAPDAVELRDVKGEVILKNVTFGYLEGQTVLSDISLYAKPGQKIAFVGSTGAGKTTVTNLLNRFYDIREGEITIDGIPLTQIKRDSLRQNIAMILQDTHLFSGTVRENIRYGRLDATDEEVIAAAKAASAHEFIMHLEHGYDTVLEGDGMNLSQGQRQLLNIARAAVSKAPILILDEATSSIDTRTEQLIEEGMDRLMASRTTFVIAHRLSTVRNANAIMVLEKGRIIERGDHDDLLAQKGRYYELWTGRTELD